MAAAKNLFECQHCAATTARWQGQCPECKSWNSLVEQKLSAPQRPTGSKAGGGYAGQASALVQLDQVELTQQQRLKTGSKELDRALGGGLVSGEVVLLGGDPGIGKSTLLLQSLFHLAASGKVLYISGEESAAQVSLRARRLGLTGRALPFVGQTRVDDILATLKAEQPEVAVVDSVQTLYVEGLASAPGSVSQVRESAALLTQYAKTSGLSLFLVGHVTKEGALAGPRVLEHIVDAVLYFEGDSHSAYRLIRAAKNRFGSAGEIGVFAMTETGLKDVSNPSAMFLSSRTEAPGSAVVVAHEGTRSFLVEVQALAAPCYGLNPKRLAVGLDSSRLFLLLAVLARHLGLPSHQHDVFANAVGGIRLDEPAADLAVAMALCSSLNNLSLPPQWVMFGEVGLIGEIRPVQRGQERLREAQKIGFTHALIPQANAPKAAIAGLKVHPVSTIAQAWQTLKEAAQGSAE